MNNGYPPFPPYPPRPYGPDWPGPNVHPDWPHYRYWHQWNDSEPAALVPWNAPCCPPSADECVCVTYQDINMWNTISAVSAFADLDFSGISGLTALSGLSEMLSAALIVGDNYEMWSSAQYIPNIYDQLSAISAVVNRKEYISATSAHLSAVYADPNYFVGNGTKEHVLKFSQLGEMVFDKVLDATYEPSAKDESNLSLKYPYTLVTNKECDIVMKNLQDLNSAVRDIRNSISGLNIRVKALEDKATVDIAENTISNLEKRIAALETKNK